MDPNEFDGSAAGQGQERVTVRGRSRGICLATQIDAVAVGLAEAEDEVAARVLTEYVAVSPQIARQHVITEIAGQRVVALPAEERVVPLASEEVIGPRISGEDVIADIPEDEIVTEIAADYAIALSAINRVKSLTVIERIRSLVAKTDAGSGSLSHDDEFVVLEHAA